jgi:hypothetical protein
MATEEYGPNMNHASSSGSPDTTPQPTPRLRSRASRRLAVIGTIVVVLLLIGVVAIVLFLRSRPPSLHIVWQAPATSSLFSIQDKQSIEGALTAAQPTSTSAPTNLEVDIINAQREGDWAVFSATGRSPSNSSTSDEPGFFIAHHEGATWAVFFPGSPHFCDELQHVPDTLLAPIDKSYFC